MKTEGVRNDAWSIQGEADLRPEAWDKTEPAQMALDSLAQVS